MRLAGRPTAAVLGIALFVLVAIEPAASQPPPSASAPPPAPRLAGGPLLDALRSGGNVIYFRHAATVAEQADTGDPLLNQCETQRNLSAEGRRMAKEIGAAIKTLGVRVGRVVTSPYCRTRETAELAFGRHERSNALYFAVGVDREGRAAQRAQLLRLLSTAPEAGTNVVLVSHNANLKEATGIWPKREGDAHVFRPRPDGSHEYLGEILFEQWGRWLQDSVVGTGPATGVERIPQGR